MIAGAGFAGSLTVLVLHNPGFKKTYADILKIISDYQPSREDITEFTNLVREKIHPYNTVDLMEPSF